AGLLEEVRDRLRLFRRQRLGCLVRPRVYMCVNMDLTQLLLEARRVRTDPRRQPARGAAGSREEVTLSGVELHLERLALVCRRLPDSDTERPHRGHALISALENDGEDGAIARAFVEQQ